ALPTVVMPEALALPLRPFRLLSGDHALVVEQGIDRAGGVGLGHFRPHGQRRGQLGFVHGGLLVRSSGGIPSESAPIAGGRPITRIKPALLWGIPRKTARSLAFPTPPPRSAGPSD